MGKRKEITGKDNGKQKMWIMITVIIVFFAMAGYAGMSNAENPVCRIQKFNMKCEIERMEIIYTFYFFAFFGKK